MFAGRWSRIVRCAFVSSVLAMSSPAGAAFTYQGQLKRNGLPVTDTCALTFRLFTVPVGGTQIGSDVVISGVDVVNGLFTTDVTFSAASLGGSARWLEVAAACTGDPGPLLLTPRQEIKTALNVPIPLNLSSDQANVPIVKASNTSATSGAAGVLGEATATASASTIGVWGTSSSPAGIGVYGQHKALTGTAAGVVGETLSNSGSAAGVYGKATGAAAVNYGVFGETLSTGGRGVYGKATAATGTNYGVYGETASADSAAVHGFGGLGDGVSGRTNGEERSGVIGVGTSAYSNGVLGRHTSLAGTHAGVHGETASGTGGARGVYGLATNAAGATYGVYGEAASTSGQGVFGRATAATGTAYGVQGETYSGTTGAAGVFGFASEDVGQTYGVLGKCNSNAGYAVFGNHPGSGRGVFGMSAAGPGVYATTGTGANALYAERTVNGNKAWLGGTNEGAWAESGSGNGLVAKTTSGTAAVLGERTGTANKGWFGGATEGTMGQASQGSGVAGITSDAAGYGGYFRNDGGGPAIFADGLARVRTLEILDGGDMAEPFDVAGDVAPGMVVVIDPSRPGGLRVSDRPYDRRVAGVISGANGLNAGVVLRPRGHEAVEGDTPVALSGRVWCWCDAAYGPIEPGDLLTTSATPGHAMNAADSHAAPGATLGKAMTPLPSGRGLVLVLVNLQ